MKQMMRVLATVSLMGVTSSLWAALPEPPDPREVSKMTFEQRYEQGAAAGDVSDRNSIT